VTIIIDGERREVPEGATVAEVLRMLSEPALHILVELNGTHVPPERQGETRIEPGDRLEIIHPAFGG
jgi:thiamine biosynthesis protein ThiS